MGNDIFPLICQADALLILELHQEGYISGGKAAELLGLTKRDFASLLARKGLDYFRLTPEEWAEEVAIVKSLDGLR